MPKILKRLFFLYKIRKNQWIKEVELRRIQEQRLKMLLKHAYKNVSYYRHLFDLAGVRPGDIKSIFDLSKIPITSRAQIQCLQPAEIVADGYNINKLIKQRTSGSTGLPLSIFVTKEEASIRGLFSLRMYLENGYGLKDNMLTVIDPRHFKYKKRYFQFLGIMNEYFISPFDDIERQLEAYMLSRPDIIRGYASCIKALALAARGGGMGRHPGVIFCTGEILDTATRDLIKSVFQAEIIDYYSSLEFGNIAWECKFHQGYHINSDSLILECIRDGRRAPPGEEGEAVITNLYSYAMPLIRYKIGDNVILNNNNCPCGRVFPLIERIDGRIVDYIVLSDGRKISPYALTCGIEEFTEIKKYQIIQKKLDKIIVKIEKEESITQGIVSEVEKKFKEILKSNINIELVLVDKIPEENSGKYRVVTSNIKK